MASTVLMVAAPVHVEDLHWTGKCFLWHGLVLERAVAPPLTSKAIATIGPMVAMLSVKTVPNLSPKSSYTTVTTLGALG